MIIEGMLPSELAAYAKICGQVLARGHARSGDAVAIASYVGSSDVLDRAVADFAKLHAEQNGFDYAAMTAAVQDGRITAQSGL